jgi:hypothetical protein
MTRIITIIIILFALTSCKKGEDLTEDEIFTIINEIIADDSVKLGPIYFEFSDLYLADNYKKYFSNDDVEFIYRQKSLFTKVKIRPNKLKTNYSKFLEVHEELNHGILVHISLPIISIDRKTVLIGFESNGNCNMCESGGKYLYKKINNRWKRIETYEEWISINEKKTTAPNPT